MRYRNAPFMPGCSSSGMTRYHQSGVTCEGLTFALSFFPSAEPPAATASFNRDACALFAASSAPRSSWICDWRARGPPGTDEPAPPPPLGPRNPARVSSRSSNPDQAERGGERSGRSEVVVHTW